MIYLTELLPINGEYLWQRFRFQTRTPAGQGHGELHGKSRSRSQNSRAELRGSNHKPEHAVTTQNTQVSWNQHDLVKNPANQQVSTAVYEGETKKLLDFSDVQNEKRFFFLRKVFFHALNLR